MADRRVRHTPWDAVADPERVRLLWGREGSGGENDSEISAVIFGF